MSDKNPCAGCFKAQQLINELFISKKEDAQKLANQTGKKVAIFIFGAGYEFGTVEGTDFHQIPSLTREIVEPVQ